MKKIKDLVSELENEAYDYFSNNIKELPKTASGNWDFRTGEFVDNDVDAFRHAYVSGVLTQKYGESIANIMGQAKEVEGDYKRNQSAAQKNMDLWNNQVGRRYGKKTSSKSQLAEKLHEALTNSELIITVDTEADSRTYEGGYSEYIDNSKPVVVVQESDTGRNELFFDTHKVILFSRSEFVSQIQSNNYPGYYVAITEGVPTPVSKPDGNSANNLG